jgi:glycosyltransferase involved in cell wall biosynthesis
MESSPANVPRAAKRTDGSFSDTIMISIVTPLHNKAPYVAETIRSALAQTMTDWEMIVVENGSTDGGSDVVRQFPDPRIRLVESSRCGPGAARNFGLAQAQGDWILFLDADDLIEADFLLNRMNLAGKNPAADLLIGCWEEFKDGEPSRILRRPPAHGGSTRALEQAAVAFAPWPPHAALVKRIRLMPDLYWPEALDRGQSEDTAFWFPVICDASVAWTDQAGALYRLQTAGSRNEIHDAEKWIRAVIGVIDHNINFLRRKGTEPDSEQCASIVRVLESSYRLGIARHSRAAARAALKEAKFWLAKCPASDPSLALRKLFGLRLFNLLRYGVI